jgi:hypothetical protein
MMRSASAALVLAASQVACSKDPTRRAYVDLPAVPATPSKPSASASASPSEPVFSGPPLAQQVLAGFPACVVDPPPRPPEPYRCNIGSGACLRNLERIRSVGDDQYTATELRPALAECLRPSLLPSSLVWATIPILPSGAVCAPSFASNVTFLPQSLACAARRLHAYRSTVADRSSGITFAVVVPVGAPVVLRAPP